MFLTHFIVFLILLWEYSLIIVNTEDADCEHHCIQNASCKFTKVENVCYYFFQKNTKTWKDSKTFCEEQALQLTHLPQDEKTGDGDSGKYTLIKTIVKNIFNGSLTENFSPEEVWLDERRNRFGDWTFVDGSKFPGQIEGDSCAKCLATVQIGSSNGMEAIEPHAADCTDQNYFICRFERPSRNLSSVLTSSVKKTWHEARNTCKDLGGDLLYLKDQENFQDILNAARWSLTNKTFFTGLRKGKGCTEPTEVRCRDITKDGNAGGAQCVFPFKYKKKTYNQCTADDEDANWCATTDNYNHDKKWGYCIGCPATTKMKPPSSWCQDRDACNKKENCSAINMKTGKWQTNNCVDEKPGLCQNGNLPSKQNGSSTTFAHNADNDELSNRVDGSKATTCSTTTITILAGILAVAMVTILALVSYNIFLRYKQNEDAAIEIENNPQYNSQTGAEELHRNGTLLNENSLYSECRI